MTEARKVNANTVHFDLEQLQAIASDCIPAQRKAKVDSILAEIFGDRPVPPSEYLDMMFGLDMVVNYRGWIIGLDVTLNPHAVEGKRRKQAYLADAYQRLGLDRWAVILVPCKDLKAELSAIIK